jgi:hypothetical protein
MYNRYQAYLNANERILIDRILNETTTIEKQKEIEKEIKEFYNPNFSLNELLQKVKIIQNLPNLPCDAKIINT